MASPTFVTGFFFASVLGFAASCTLTTVTLTSYTSQVISSPNYPSQYPTNVEYCWRISTSDASRPRIKLNVEAFRLESSSRCTFDYVEIHDGSSSASTSIGKYCDTDKPCDVVSEGSDLYIYFNSDTSLTYTGFSFTLSTTDEGSNDCSKLSAAAIFGIVIGCLIGVACIVMLIICIVYMCKGKSNAVSNRGTVVSYNNRNSMATTNIRGQPQRPPAYNVATVQQSQYQNYPPQNQMPPPPPAMYAGPPSYSSVGNYPPGPPDPAYPPPVYPPQGN